MSLYVSWGRLPGLIQEFAEQGLDGVEAWHPTAKVRACKRLEELGARLGLFITAGSDFHGESRPDRKLGISAGGRKIEASILEAIPPLRANFSLLSPCEPALKRVY
jgi:sugar phosphate isomerase/epimerase